MMSRLMRRKLTAAASADVSDLRSLVQCRIRLRHRQVFAEPFAEHALQILPRARSRDRLHENDIVRQPPLREVRSEMPAHRFERRRAPRAWYDDRNRSLVPLRVRHGDHDRFTYVRVREEHALERDAADPLAAGLHEILGPILNRYAAARVDRDDVARTEPAVAGESVG